MKRAITLLMALSILLLITQTALAQGRVRLAEAESNESAAETGDHAEETEQQEEQAEEAEEGGEHGGPRESNAAGAWAAAGVSGIIAAGAIGFFATRKQEDSDADEEQH